MHRPAASSAPRDPIATPFLLPTGPPGTSKLEKTTSIFKQTGKAGTSPRAMDEKSLEEKFGKFSVKLTGRESVPRRKRIHCPDT